MQSRRALPQGPKQSRCLRVFTIRMMTGTSAEFAALNPAGGVALARASNRFSRKHVDSVHSILSRRPLLGSRTKTIKTRCDTNILKADLRQIFNELCLRQSAGDSTGPQIDIAAGILGEFDIQCDIGKVQAAARL